MLFVSDDGNGLYLSIRSVSCRALQIHNLSVMTREKSDDASKFVRQAINQISSIRGKLGAAQNRLEHTVNNLMNSKEAANRI